MEQLAGRDGGGHGRRRAGSAGRWPWPARPRACGSRRPTSRPAPLAATRRAGARHRRRGDRRWRPTSPTPASVRALAARVDAELGGADLLCNNAGVFAGGTLWSEPVADFTWVMGVNFYGILHGIQAFVPGMIERGRPGHVVNTISAAGHLPVGVLRGVHDVEVRGARAHRVPGRRARGRGRADRRDRAVPRRGAHRHRDVGAQPHRRRDVGAPRRGTRLRRAGARRPHRRGVVRPPRSRRWCSTRCATGRYLQLTHDGYVGALRTRTDELLAGGLPTLPYFD